MTGTAFDLSKYVQAVPEGNPLGNLEEELT